MRKICLFVISLVMFSFNVYASSLEFSRSEDNNYGVNKYWVINEKNLKNVLNTPYVDSSLKVYDFGDVLTESDEQSIYNLIEDFISKTDMDMVFVTVDLPYSYDSVNENYAADFYDYNDFGINYDNYSGVLLLRNVYSEDPYYNVYMFGNAQLYFDFDRAEAALDDIYNDFHSGRYVSGVKTFLNDYLMYFKRGVALEDYYVDEDGYLQQFPPTYHPPIFFALCVSGVITFIVIAVMVKKNKMVKNATKATEYLAVETVQFNKRVDQFLRSHTTHYTVSSSTGSSGGGSHSSSGSSGGGHSSGGGRHG